MSQAAPGWYDDPENPDQLRYFDGILWTQHVQPRVAPQAAQSTIGRAPDVPQSQSPAAPGALGGPGGQQGLWWRGPVTHDGVPLAPLGVRVFAKLLDYLLVGLLSTLAIAPWWDDLRAIVQKVLEANPATSEEMTQLVTTLLQPVVLPLFVVGLLVRVAYEVAFLTLWSATPGKLALGLVVRPVEAPGPVGVVRALRRQVVGVVSDLLGLVPVLGFLGTMLGIADIAWVLADPQRQALHDKVAGTVVVRRR